MTRVLRQPSGKMQNYISPSGMREAFLMHVSTALDSIKKWGTFKAYEEAQEAYAVPSHQYVGRTCCHIYDWSARQCRSYLGCTREVKHQTGIFQITTLVHLQGTVHRSMYESSVTTDHCLLTHGISPTVFFWRYQPSGIGDSQECPAGVNLKRYRCILNTQTHCH
jgi:hypothetical protein